MYPYAIAAREGLRTELPRMPQYHARAVELAAALRDIPGVAVSPDPPACNAFVVHLEGEHAALLGARDAVAESRGLIVFQHLAQTAHPRVCSFELIVGANALALSTDRITDAVGELVRRAR
jgi:threonine aldolase